MATRKRTVRYRAKETMFLPGRRLIAAGDIITSKDPALKGREMLFERVGVEQATAEPGELRNVTTRPKKAPDADPA